MSEPIDPGVPAPSPVAGTDPVVALETELASGDGTRLARYGARVQIGVWLLALPVVGTGALALLVGVAAWRDEPVALALVVLLCAPAIGRPLYVARRAAQLARAASHPRELAEQAHDLVTRVRDSAELRTLAGRVAQRSARGRALPGRRGGLRGAVGFARLASTVIGQARPDDQRHPLLVPFTPERLRLTWTALGLALWGWLVALVVLVVSAPVLLADLV